MHIFKAIYIHIPFCQSKCSYCDFPSYPQYFPDYVDEYISALVWEIDNSELQLAECATLFIGGGTPSLLMPKQLERIFLALAHKGLQFNEISIEINPGTVGAEKIYCMREFGINRLSFGVQSFDDALLKSLSRIHTAKQAIDNIKLAQQLGFENINLDLMYGLPGQTIEQVGHDLQQAAELGVQHISAYALKIEPDTRLDQLVAQGQVQPLDEEISANMYDLVPELLSTYGFNRYEISNYARPGFECRHNQVYWHYQPYKAFGVAGCSFTGQERITNTFDLPSYLAAHQANQPVPCDIEPLDVATRRAEYLFMNLRMTNGFNRQEFYELFNEDIYTIYKEVLNKYLNNGMLSILNDGNIALTPLGIKYSNVLFEDLL